MLSMLFAYFLAFLVALIEFPVIVIGAILGAMLAAAAGAWAILTLSDR